MVKSRPMNNIIKDKSYGIIPVFKRGNDYLFCVVLHNAGHWAFPKGHLIENETPLDTAKREFYEETGIDQCSISKNISFEEKYNFEEGGKIIEKIVIYFLGFTDKLEIKTPEKFKLEILDAKWLTYDETLKLLTYETAKDLLKKVKDYLQRNNRNMTFKELLIKLIEKNSDIEKIELVKYIPKTNRAHDDCFLVNANEITKKFLNDKLKDIKDPFLLGFNSKVLLKNGEIRHIPLLDFSFSKIENYDINRVSKVLSLLKLKKGCIIWSGKCYHFMGENLLTQKEWENLMEQCRLFPEIGEKFINRQLQFGRATIRISTNYLKPTEPFLIKEFQAV